MATFNLDDDVVEYIASNYTHELGDELLRGLELLHMFGINEITEGSIVSIIASTQIEESDVVRDSVVHQVIAAIRQIATEHGLELQPNAGLYFLNEVVSAIYLLQQLNDYTTISTILESSDDDDDKIAQVVSSLSTLTAVEVRSEIVAVDQRLIAAIQAYIDQKTPSVVNEPNHLLIQKYRDFRKWIGETGCLGVRLLANDVAIGLPLESYIHYIKLPEKDTSGQLALDVLSVLLLASDGYELPMIAYRKISGHLATDLDQLSRLETTMLRINLDFEEYRKSTDHAET